MKTTIGRAQAIRQLVVYMVDLARKKHYRDVKNWELSPAFNRLNTRYFEWFSNQDDAELARWYQLSKILPDGTSVSIYNPTKTPSTVSTAPLATSRSVRRIPHSDKRGFLCPQVSTFRQRALSADPTLTGGSEQ